MFHRNTLPFGADAFTDIAAFDCPETSRVLLAVEDAGALGDEDALAGVVQRLSSGTVAALHALVFAAVVRRDVAAGALTVVAANLVLLASVARQLTLCDVVSPVDVNSLVSTGAGVSSDVGAHAVLEIVCACASVIDAVLVVGIDIDHVVAAFEDIALQFHAFFDRLGLSLLIGGAWIDWCLGAHVCACLDGLPAVPKGIGIGLYVSFLRHEVVLLVPVPVAAQTFGLLHEGWGSRDIGSGASVPKDLDSVR